MQRKFTESTLLTINGASHTRSLLARRRTEQLADLSSKGDPLKLFVNRLAVSIGNSHRRRDPAELQKGKGHDDWRENAGDLVRRSFLRGLATALEGPQSRKALTESALIERRESEAAYIRIAANATSAQVQEAVKRIATARQRVADARAIGITNDGDMLSIWRTTGYLLDSSLFDFDVDAGAFSPVEKAHALYRASLAVERKPSSRRHPLFLAGADDTAAIAIARKLQGLYSYPSLAKHFGLSIDVEIPAATMRGWEESANVKVVGGAGYGYIAADLGSSGNMTWTSYKRLPAPLPRYREYFNKTKSFAADWPRHPFLACTSDEIDAAILPGAVDNGKAADAPTQFIQYFGLQNLGERINGIRRFALESVDVQAWTNDRENTAQNEQNRRDAGEIGGRSSYGFSGLRTVGIAIIDQARAADAQAGVAAQQVFPKKHTFLDSVQLTVGQRVDVRVKHSPAAQDGLRSRWFGLNERITKFPDVLKNPAAKSGYFPLRDRGYIRSVDRVMQLTPALAHTRETQRGLRAYHRMRFLVQKILPLVTATAQLRYSR
jgi:hypothetical protein